MAGRIVAWLEHVLKLALTWVTASLDAREVAGRLFELGRLATHPRWDNEAVIRSLCMNAYLGDSTSLCRVLGRYRMFVDTRDVGLSPHLMAEGIWETWHVEAMATCVRPGMKAVDAGANLGFFTLLLADLVGPAGEVHAFEPNPSMARLLRRSVEVNGFGARTTVYEMGLDDHAGELALDVTVTEPKNARLVATGSLPAASSVETCRLDSFPEMTSLDFIKIDVEGAEERLWRGMEGILRGQRPLIVFMEFAADRYVHPRSFIEAMLAPGFTLELVDMTRGIVPVTVDALLARPSNEDQLVVLRR